MIKDIYIRDENDPNFEPGIIDYSNEVESIISQIRMLLGTKNGEVLGDYNFGYDLEYLVFNTRTSADLLAGDILDKIKEYVVYGENFYIDVDVNFGDSGKGYDYCIVDISINGKKAIGFLIDKE